MRLILKYKDGRRELENLTFAQKEAVRAAEARRVPLIVEGHVFDYDWQTDDFGDTEYNFRETDRPILFPSEGTV